MQEKPSFGEDNMFQAQLEPIPSFDGKRGCIEPGALQNPSKSYETKVLEEIKVVKY